MDNEGGGGWVGTIIGAIIGAIIIYAIFGSSGKYEGQTAEDWFNEYDAAQADVTDLQNALQDANTNIDEANSTIENLNSNIDSAKIYAWESYNDMGDALDSLETGYTVDNVDDPTQ